MHVVYQVSNIRTVIPYLSARWRAAHVNKTVQPLANQIVARKEMCQKHVM